MTIYRYTCSECGIVTRVQDNQSWKACACQAPPEVVNEDEEAQGDGVP
jgi:predicted nucleic acid-binding Zn ribbon protein